MKEYFANRERIGSPKVQRKAAILAIDDRCGGKLGWPRDADLSHHHQIEWGIKNTRDLRRHGYAAAR